jgi:hypothetical protein
MTILLHCYDFSRKSLSKYLMDTIDFNKHDINIFIIVAKIVRYGRHWDESCNEWRLLLIIYFDDNFPNAKLRPYDDYKNMSITLIKETKDVYTRPLKKLKKK